MASCGCGQPQGRVACGAPLHAQAGLLDDPLIALAGGGALGAPERLGHFHQVVAFRLGDEAGQGQQFPALILGQLRQLSSGRRQWHAAPRCRCAPACADSAGRGGRSVVSIAALYPSAAGGILKHHERRRIYSPDAGFAARRRFASTLGRSTDVDACAGLVARLEYSCWMQAAQHLRAGRAPTGLPGRAAISAATCA